jgi:hypothetical protein
MEQCKWYAVCPMRRFYERGLLPKGYVDYYCKKHWRECVRYQMEEAGIPHPDNMRQDGVIDETLV